MLSSLGGMFGSREQDGGVLQLEAPPVTLPGCDLDSPEDFLRMVKSYPCPSVQSLLLSNGQNGILLKSICDVLRNSIALRSEEGSLSDETTRSLKECATAFENLFFMLCIFKIGRINTRKVFSTELCVAGSGAQDVPLDRLVDADRRNIEEMFNSVLSDGIRRQAEKHLEGSDRPGSSHTQRDGDYPPNLRESPEKESGSSGRYATTASHSQRHTRPPRPAFLSPDDEGRKLSAPPDREGRPALRERWEDPNVSPRDSIRNANVANDRRKERPRERGGNEKHPEDYDEKHASESEEEETDSE